MISEATADDEVRVVWKPASDFKFTRAFDFGGAESMFAPIQNEVS